MAKSDVRLIEEGGSLWLTAPIDARWKVLYRIEIVHERVIFGEARIVASGRTIPPDGVTAPVLRSVAVGEHRRGLIEEFSRVSARLGEAAEQLGDLTRSDLVGAGLPLALFELDAPKRRPRTRKNDLWFAEVAKSYAALVEAGSTRPIPALAKLLGLSSNTTAGAVRDARAKGFLTRTTGGRAGGRLTAKAKRILDEKEE